MQKPEMIIFDYGHTLLYQPDFNTSNGNKAIYPYISRNPRNISFEEYDKIWSEKAGIFDLYIMLRYMQRKDLIKYFKEYGVKKLPICEEGKSYLDNVCKSICNESKRQKHTIFETDRFWSYLELISHTNISEEIAQIVLQRLVQIKNEVDVRTYKDTISRFVGNICDETLYENQIVCNLANNFADKIIGFIVADKAISSKLSSVLINLLYFIIQKEYFYRL